MATVNSTTKRAPSAKWAAICQRRKADLTQMGLRGVACYVCQMNLRELFSFVIESDGHMRHTQCVGVPDLEASHAA